MGGGGGGEGATGDDDGDGSGRHLRHRHAHRVLRHVEAVLRQVVRPEPTEDHADGLPGRRPTAGSAPAPHASRQAKEQQARTPLGHRPPLDTDWRQDTDCC